MGWLLVRVSIELEVAVEFAFSVMVWNSPG